MKGHSTGTCLLDFLDDIFTNVDKGVPSGVLFLDLRKAFDTVNHEILLQKLVNMGVHVETVQWFRSYLEGRSQVTKVNGTMSQSAFVTCGVPQGSILGPLLFLIYINDLPFALQNYKINLYADDTAITVSEKDPNILAEKLNNAMKIISNWFNCNKLSLNHKKSKIMFFGTRPQLAKLSEVKVYAGQSELERVDRFKYLGVMLDSALTFSHHVEYLKSKTLSKIGLLGKAGYFVDHNTSIMLYKTLILPYFDYCDYVYHCLNQKDCYTLQKLQNCSLRQILKCDKLSSTIHMHNECEIEMLDKRRDRHVSQEMYRAIHGMAPRNIQNMFKHVQDTHNVNTRSKNNEQLYIPRCRLEVSKRNFRYRGVHNWNPLPLAIRNAPTFTHFKTSCMNYYLT